MKKYEVTYKIENEVKADIVVADYYDSFKTSTEGRLFEFFVDHSTEPKVSYFNVIKVKEIDER